MRAALLLAAATAQLYEPDITPQEPQRRFVVTAGCPSTLDADQSVRLFVAVPSAAVFSTVLLLTLLEVYAEKLGFPLLNSDARNIADGRAVTLGAILTVHALWIIILGGARFGDEAARLFAQ